MIGITPVDIFPLNYPSGDTTIPSRGAKAVPFILDWAKDNQYDANLLQVRDQKFFGSLRCLWIDASECIQNFTVAVNGTEQIFTIAAGSSAYYPVINLNVPVITFLMASKESTLARVICLNFVPSITTPSQITFPSSVVVSGNVAVTNFPAVQNVDIIGQSSSIDVIVSNFPASQPVSGTVAINNFPTIQTIHGTAVKIACNTIATIASTNLGPPTVNVIRSILIVSFGAVFSTSPVVFTLEDGSGTPQLVFGLPVESTGGFFGTLVDAQNMNVILNNAGVSATMTLNANLTSGFFSISISYN